MSHCTQFEHIVDKLALCVDELNLAKFLSFNVHIHYLNAIKA